MRRPGNRWGFGGVLRRPATAPSPPLSDRDAELAMFQVLLTSLNKRYVWDRIKCAIATGIPAFWISIILLRPNLEPAVSPAVPPWLGATMAPLLEHVPAAWTVAVSVAIAALQWYNLATYQRRILPLVRDMYERALARRDRGFLSILGKALRFQTIRQAVRAFISKLFRRPR
jgi:hypothetical protein